MTDTRPPRGSRKGWWIGLTGLVLLGAAAAYVYFAVLHPTPRAHRHMPRGTTLALRVDALELFAWKPMREKFLPVLAESKQRDGDANLKRFARLKKATGVAIPEDLREAVIASVDGSEWVGAFGGTIAAGRFVDGLESVLKEEGASGFTRDGDLLVHNRAIAIGQAEDGTIVVGSTSSIVRAALPERDEEPSAEDLPLPTKGAVTFMVNSAAYRGVLGYLPTFLSPVDTLSKVEKLNGTFTLSDSPELAMRLRPKGVPASELASSLESQLATVKLALVFSPSDFGGARQAIAAATVRADGTDVRVAAPWPYAALEANVAHLAEIVTVALAQSSPVK